MFQRQKKAECGGGKLIMKDSFGSLKLGRIFEVKPLDAALFLQPPPPQDSLIEPEDT